MLLKASAKQPRSILPGGTEETAQARYELVNRAFHSPLLEKPEDVAAIWKAVKHQRSGGG